MCIQILQCTEITSWVTEFISEIAKIILIIYSKEEIPQIENIYKDYGPKLREIKTIHCSNLIQVLDSVYNNGILNIDTLNGDALRVLERKNMLHLINIEQNIFKGAIKLINNCSKLDSSQIDNYIQQNKIETHQLIQIGKLILRKKLNFTNCLCTYLHSIDSTITSWEKYAVVSLYINSGNYQFATPLIQALRKEISPLTISDYWLGHLEWVIMHNTSSDKSEKQKCYESALRCLNECLVIYTRSKLAYSGLESSNTLVNEKIHSITQYYKQVQYLKALSGCDIISLPIRYFKVAIPPFYDITLCLSKNEMAMDSSITSLKYMSKKSVSLPFRFQCSTKSTAGMRLNIGYVLLLCSDEPNKYFVVQEKSREISCKYILNTKYKIAFPKPDVNA